MSQRQFVIIGLLVGLGLGFASPCAAVILFEKGKSDPIRGFLVAEDSVRVIVDVLLPNGETQQRIFPRTSIEDMIRAVSSERLESLRPERPQDYRDYAEELAGKINDPEARSMAIRLYQIAAYLAPESLGKSALLGMVSLARNAEEERRFRAVAYLLDPAHNRSVLRAPGTSPPKATATEKDPDRSKHLRHALRLLRDGRVNEARALARRTDVHDQLEKLVPVLTTPAAAKTRGGEKLPAAFLAQVLTAELALDGAPEAGKPPTPRSADWDAVLAEKGAKGVPVLALEYLTEFDPRKCHFRNGKWEEP